ncbi:DoxX family protein [Nocardia uniformis]|uniref:DoxX family protein n=1 Tax=Nocardia uniformis TaxID=53432 RepID=A0A849CCR2_9NOCA|nr:DoxX family protein [Nocardia uniformis]NNH75706.1 DoxX family protein [Nocardia uniformis]
MDVLVLIGRILFVVVFLGSGIAHLTQTDAMAGYAQSKGIPAPKLAVQASGVLLVLGALMILLGVWADLGALLLVVFLLPTAFLMHAFWKETDPTAKQTEMIQFNKDISLAGAAIALFAFFAHTPELGLSITGPLFSLG